MAPEPVPFRSSTSAEEVEDLRRRLRATRWPDAPQDAGWSLGTDVDALRDLAAYWADDFDWSAQEAALNALPRFSVELDGLQVHALHVRAVGPVARPLPLVLTHGWPDSCWRYLKVLPHLVDPAAHGADPEDAFDVVVPDMPGFGWSSRPTTPLDSVSVAGLWPGLMSAFGHERFGAAGGDVGSHVSRYLALDHPDRVVAVHRTDGGVPSPAALPDGLALEDLTPEEQEWVRAAGAWGASEGAYAAVHRTKPQTAAAGLNDSPAGLAAWVVEKLRSWSDCGGDLWTVYTRDDVCTALSIYWFTQTIGSSMRMYAANAAIAPAQLRRRVEVPSGFSLFPGDILRPPRAWLERTTNLVGVNVLPRGGHFAPYEQPELYAAELRDFFRPYREGSAG